MQLSRGGGGGGGMPINKVTRVLLGFFVLESRLWHATICIQRSDSIERQRLASKRAPIMKMGWSWDRFIFIIVIQHLNSNLNIYTRLLVVIVAVYL